MDEEALLLQKSCRQAAGQPKETRWHQLQAGASHPQGQENLIRAGGPAPGLRRGYWRYQQLSGRHQILGVRVPRFPKSPEWHEAAPGTGTLAP